MDDRLGGYWLGPRLGGQSVEAYDESGLRHALTRCRPAGDGAALQRVHSVHVARVVAVERTYLVSEYVAGPSLREVVAARGPYPCDDLYLLAVAAATALAAIHEAGVAHGALDPDAVRLTPDGPRLVGLGTGHDAEAPADVRAWAQVLVYAAGGPAELDRALGELAAAALQPDPERRPAARQLLLSLLDQPQSQQGRLRPPWPVTDPPLGARAEQLYAELTRAEQDLVPEVLLRLVGGDGHGDDTRLRLERAELVSGRTPAQAAAIGQILQRYGEAGLLALDGDTVTIGHGALLRAWPRLREWLDEERDGLAVHRELAGAARRWDGSGRRDADLFHDGTLERALDWAATGRRRVTLSGAEQDFLDAGRALGRRRGRRRWTVMAALVAVALVVAVWQYGSARGQVDEAMARVAAARADAARAADPVLARKLSFTAWRLAPVAEARRQLAKSDTDPVVGAFTDPHATERSLHALSADGRKLAALTDGVLRVYDGSSGDQLAQAPGPPEKIRAMAWSPMGRMLALVGIERSYLWDTTAGEGVEPGFGRGLSQPGQHSAWFSPGGTILFAAGSQYGERWAWHLGTGRAVFAGQYVVVGPGDRRALVFDGQRSQVRDLRTGRVTAAPWLARMPPEYTTFSPDGTRVAIAEEAGVQIYDLTGVPTLAVPLRPAPGTLQFSPDGRYLAGTDSDRVRVWLVSTGALTVDRQVTAADVDRPAQARFEPRGEGVMVLAGRGTVLSIAADGVHRAAPAPPDRSADSICADLGGLTPAEWARHLPELPYRALCDPPAGNPH